MFVFLFEFIKSLSWVHFCHALSETKFLFQHHLKNAINNIHEFNIPEQFVCVSSGIAKLLCVQPSPSINWLTVIIHFSLNNLYSKQYYFLYWSFIIKFRIFNCFQNVNISPEMIVSLPSSDCIVNLSIWKTVPDNYASAQVAFIFAPV